MKERYLESIQLTQALSMFNFVTNVRLWLLAIAACLMTTHVVLTGRDVDVSSQSMSILYWFAVSSLVFKKRHHLSLDSDLGSSLTGLFLLIVVMLRSATLPSTNFLSVSPFLSGIGLCLLASGIKGLKQYWRELVILFFFGVPKVFLVPLLDITLPTAKFSTFILWYLGLNVTRQGTQVLLPKAGVNVDLSCSGFNSMFYLLGLAIIFLLMFPLQGVKKNLIVPFVAVGTGFILNGGRIALLAIMSNAQNNEAFDYWHTGAGALVFPMIAVILFGIFCWVLQQQQLSKLLQ